MRYELFAFLTSWLVYFGVAALIMWLDARRQAAIERSTGTPTYADRRIWPYFIFAFVCGPLPLIMYFYGTRRSARGALIGFGMAALHAAVVGALGFGLMAVAARLEDKRACDSVPVPDDGATCMYRVISRGASGYELLDHACQNGGFHACAALVGVGENGQDTNTERAARARAKAVDLCQKNAQRDLSCAFVISAYGAKSSLTH